MQCPKCGFEMDPLDDDCRRCKNLERRRKREAASRTARKSEFVLVSAARALGEPSLSVRDKRLLLAIGAIVLLAVLAVVLRDKGDGSSSSLVSGVLSDSRHQPVDTSLTPQYMDEYLSAGRGGERLTDAQRKAVWKERFDGRRVRWTGQVVSVGDTLGSYTVSLKCCPSTMTSDTRFDVRKDIALGLFKGDIITVEGTLHDHSMLGYRLRDVTVIGDSVSNQ